MGGEGGLIMMSEQYLASGGGGLLFLELQLASRQAEQAATESNRTGGDNNHILPGLAGIGDIERKALKPGTTDRTGFIIYEKG